MEKGKYIERAGVNFSHVKGDTLPASASARRPELAGRPYEAMGVSIIVHPRNPYVPTSHANVRFFLSIKEDGSPVWWFGGGFDLTPYYGFEEDAVHWHRTAKLACDFFGNELYQKYKEWCDEPATGPIEPSIAIPLIKIGHGTFQISLDLHEKFKIIGALNQLKP